MKRGNLLCAAKGGKTILEQRLMGLEGVALYGNVQISTQALEMLLKAGIDVSYFSYSGKYLGHMVSDNSKNIFLRLAQYDLYQEADKRLAIAKTIIDNKIANQVRVIASHHWITEYAWQKDVAEINRIRDSLKMKTESGQLLGIEGLCSKIYFSAFGEMFTSEMKFTKRSRRPPRDPVNVILSLTYTMLTKEVENSLEMASFEVCMGFLHGIRYGRKSLALDIVEEFRQPVGDRLVLKLFNKQMITREDFEFLEDSVILSEDGFKTFFRAYERWMNGTDTTSGDKSFRSRIRQQVDCLKKAVRERTEYTPYAWKAPTEGSDDANAPHTAQAQDASSEEKSKEHCACTNAHEAATSVQT